MAFKKICTLDDVWEGDMASFDIDGHEVLIVWPTDGEIRAYQGSCPHQDISLSEGKLVGKVIMCRAHQWTFDSASGQGINPGDCKLAQYPIEIRGDDIYVNTEGVTPMFSHS